RQWGQPDSRIEFQTNLHHALGPTTLLSLEGIYLHRDLGGGLFIKQGEKISARQMSAKNEVSIFRQCIRPAATTQLNSTTPPDTRGTVEVEEAAGAIARSLLNDEVTIEHDGLQTSQQIVISIDVGPAHLRTTHHRVREEIDEFAETVRLGHKV